MVSEGEDTDELVNNDAAGNETLNTVEKKVPARPPRKFNTTSDEDRAMVIKIYESGHSIKEIADVLDINRSTVYGILRKYRTTFETTAARRGGTRVPKPIDENVSQQIRRWIEEDSTIPLTRLVEKVKDTFGIRVNLSTMAIKIQEFKS